MIENNKDLMQACQKTKIEKELTEKHKASLFAFCTDFFFPTPEFFSSFLLVLAQRKLELQSSSRIADFRPSIYVIYSDSDLKLNKISSFLISKLLSTTSRKSKHI